MQAASIPVGGTYLGLASTMRSARDECRVRPSARATAVSSARCSPASTHSRCARVTAV